VKAEASTPGMALRLLAPVVANLGAAGGLSELVSGERPFQRFVVRTELPL